MEKNKQEVLKKAGIDLEVKINKYIKEQLNNSQLSKTVLLNESSGLEKIMKLQKIFGGMSPLFNLPTKNDVANTSKLVIQTDEKIDLIEEQLHDLTKNVQDVKRMLEGENVSTGDKKRGKKS